MKFLLENSELSIQVDELGAELTSIYNPSAKSEYLWNASPEYWKRHSPILFPFVGSLRNKSFIYEGAVYPASQHGFARDKRFRLLNRSDTELWFFLEDDEETIRHYPFHFRLEVGYLLKDKAITVSWRVVNRGHKEMYFSIGAHPAFNCPLHPDENNTECFIQFDNREPLHYLLINESGLAVKKPLEEQDLLATDDHGCLPYNPHLFDKDALIFEDRQCHRVSLLNSSKLPYVTVSFDAPLFGLWSPAGKNAPFFCIEPWYGRCDSEAFQGTLKEREWGNTLQAGEAFEAYYTIELY